MSAWRRRALEAFPSLRPEISRADSTIYSAFFELLPVCVAAHKASDHDSLKRIYGFAVWCARQPEKELWNAAGVAFFEKLAYSHQKEYIDWIEEAKKPETRTRRLEQTLEMLKQGKKTT